MKVFQINSVCGIRSTGRICTDIADALLEKGIECKIAYGREYVPERYKKYALRIGTDLDVKLHAVIARLFDRTGFGSIRVTKKLIRQIEEYNPDVIHLHNLHGYYVNIEILFNYLKKCNKKIIWTLHDCWALTGHCAYFEGIGCSKWKSGCYNCPKKSGYPKSIFLDCSNFNYKKKKELFCGIPDMTIVTPSEWLAKLVKQSYLSEYPIKVINNGIDTDVFVPEEGNFKTEHNLFDKKILLGVASPWSERKGLSDFVQLSSILDPLYKIVLVGLTKEQIREIPDSILSVERTNSTKELAQIYSAADIFLNLTYEDNYPTVNLEAQACGTPVITYKTGGSIESVPQENVAKKGSLDDVIRLINTDGLKCLEKDFSKSEMLRKYEELYL